MGNFDSNDEELLGFAPQITYHPPPAIRDGEVLGEREQVVEVQPVPMPTVQDIIYLKEAVSDMASIIDEQLQDIESSVAHYSVKISDLDLTDEDIELLRGIEQLTIQDIKTHYLNRAQPLSQTITNAFQKGASDITGNIDAEIYGDLFGIRNVELYVYANAVSGIITLLQNDILSNTNDLDSFHSVVVPPGIADYMSAVNGGMDKLTIAISNYISLRKKAVVRTQVANMTTPILQSIKDSNKSINSFTQGISQLMSIINLANDIKRSSEPIGDSNIHRVVNSVGNLEVDPKMALGLSFLGDKIKKPGASFLTELLNTAPLNKDFHILASQVTDSTKLVHQHQLEKMINIARLFALKNQIFDIRYDFLHDKDSKRLMYNILDSVNTKLGSIKNKDFSISKTTNDILSTFGNKLFGEQKRIFQSSPLPHIKD